MIILVSQFCSIHCSSPVGGAAASMTPAISCNIYTFLSHNYFINRYNYKHTSLVSCSLPGSSVGDFPSPARRRDQLHKHSNTKHTFTSIHGFFLLFFYVAFNLIWSIARGNILSLARSNILNLFLLFFIFFC